MPVSEDVMASRQTWFCRRTTLQLVLVALSVTLMYDLSLAAARPGDWPTAAVALALVGAIAWLVTMYFAMVDNASKVATLLEDVIKAAQSTAKVSDTPEEGRLRDVP